VAFIPNIPSSLGAISEFDKAMTVAKHKGASVAGGRRQVKKRSEGRVSNPHLPVK
jgi:hypothetical protein